MTEPERLEGRELDAAVAREVMGTEPAWWVPSMPAYSTDISAAWQVVEHFEQRGIRVDITYNPLSADWCAEFGGEGGTNYSVYAYTAPLAICVAALEALKARLAEREG